MEQKITAAEMFAALEAMSRGIDQMKDELPNAHPDEEEELDKKIRSAETAYKIMGQRFLKWGMEILGVEE